MEKKLRLNYIDALKGFAIFLMVMGHALSWSYPQGYERTPDNAFIRNLIYAFHMPLFFFMSGYVIDLYDKIWNMSFCASIIKKRFCSLLVPCVVWFLIQQCNGEVPWFLRCLFEIIIFFTVLKLILSKLNGNKWIEFIVLIILGYAVLVVFTQYVRNRCPALDSLFNMTVFQINYPYFAFGYLFRKNEMLINKKINANYLYTICIIVFIFCFYVYYWTEQPHSLHAALRYLLAFSGIYFIYTLFRSVHNEENIFYKIFVDMGKHSIEIYLLSFWLILRLPDVFAYVLDDVGFVGNVVAQLFFGFIVSIPCILCCYILVWVLGKSRLLNLLLFGKQK